MEIPTYLAMTPSEFQAVRPLPGFPAWMACHFSDSGLTDLPRQLPPHSLLILDDSIPWNGQASDRICGELREVLADFSCDGLLLDFQRPDREALLPLARQLCTSLPCPVGVSEGCAEALSCPVFVPVIPPHVPAAEALAPWAGREIWLELSPSPETITVTEAGAAAAPLTDVPALSLPLPRLHCHCRQEILPDSVLFQLARTGEDLASLLEEGDSLGVTRGVGLWQELA